MPRVARIDQRERKGYLVVPDLLSRDLLAHMRAQHAVLPVRFLRAPASGADKPLTGAACPDPPPDQRRARTGLASVVTAAQFGTRDRD